MGPVIPVAGARQVKVTYCRSTLNVPTVGWLCVTPTSGGSQLLRRVSGWLAEGSLNVPTGVLSMALAWMRKPRNVALLGIIALRVTAEINSRLYLIYRSHIFYINQITKLRHVQFVTFSL